MERVERAEWEFRRVCGLCGWYVEGFVCVVCRGPRMRGLRSVMSVDCVWGAGGGGWIVVWSMGG